VGHQDYFLAPLPGSIALFVSSLGIHIVRCNPFIMGKLRDGKVPILPSTTRRGTTLNTSVALDSPSVMSKLLTPPHTHATATTSVEFENTTDNLDDASTVLDESGLLGSFLDAIIARAKMGNTTVAPVSSPESRKCSSDDFDDAYIELDDDFIAEARATRDAKAVKKLLARRAVRYKLSPDPKFAASPINNRDKDYDFSLDLSYISIVEKELFCGTENESAMEHMNKLSTLSNLFSDDIKLRTYFVAKIFPFSLKDAAKT
jgi:mannitol/fructose-specific phosphotransferase system IIA component (Ntr-type)